jgi:GNAT superfamily N-acetyltransferase
VLVRERQEVQEVSRRIGAGAELRDLEPNGDPGLEIRELTPRDLRFLRRMLLTALFWRPKRRWWPTSVVLLLPIVSMFYRGWGRPGDVGYVAVEGRRRLGAVWYRLFTDAVHGEGFVDEDTPELALAVVAEARGRGVGRALMERIHERARADGIRQLSLSVDHDNPAKRLYESLGYDDRGDELMVLRL